MYHRLGITSGISVRVTSNHSLSTAALVNVTAHDKRDQNAHRQEDSNANYPKPNRLLLTVGLRVQFMYDRPVSLEVLSGDRRNIVRAQPVIPYLLR